MATTTATITTEDMANGVFHGMESKTILASLDAMREKGWKEDTFVVAYDDDEGFGFMFRVPGPEGMTQLSILYVD